MKKGCIRTVTDDQEGYPVHIQQALLLIAGVLRRIKEKELDKGGEKRFINDQAKGGENDEN